jgi:hypothetical protein
VIQVEIESASVKISMGPPDDEDEDMDAPVWAGVMPLRLKTGALIRDPEVPEDILPTPHMQSQTGRSF